MLFMDVLVLVILSILAASMVIWYYYWRRRMLWLMRDIVVALENRLKPLDKNYVLVGYLVGFKAEYKLDNAGRRKAYAMLLLLPRYSLLYYPIARLFTSRMDRLDVLLKDASSKPRRSHIVSEKWLKLLKQDHLDVKGLEEERIEVHGERYRVYYERREDADLLIKTLEKNEERYTRISCIPEENAVLITMRAEPSRVDNAIDDALRILRYFQH